MVDEARIRIRLDAADARREMDEIDARKSGEPQKGAASGTPGGVSKRAQARKKKQVEEVRASAKPKRKGKKTPVAALPGAAAARTAGALALPLLLAAKGGDVINSFHAILEKMGLNIPILKDLQDSANDIGETVKAFLGSGRAAVGTISALAELGIDLTDEEAEALGERIAAVEKAKAREDIAFSQIVSAEVIRNLQTDDAAKIIWKAVGTNIDQLQDRIADQIIKLLRPKGY